MSNYPIDPDRDADLTAANDLPMEEAPLGMEFSESAGDSLVNTIPADEFRIHEGIEGLLWLGYLNDTFPMMGHTFTVRTITRGERLACTLVAKEWEETLGMAAAYETATVAAALQFVDSEPFHPNMMPDGNPYGRIEAKFHVVSRWYEPLVVALGRKVQLLHYRQQEAFNDLESK